MRCEPATDPVFAQFREKGGPVYAVRKGLQLIYDNRKLFAPLGWTAAAVLLAMTALDSPLPTPPTG